MLKTFDVRKSNGSGELLCQVELDVDERGMTIRDGMRQAAVEVAASLGANRPEVRAALRVGPPGIGINRETGTPGRSGVFSVRRGMVGKGAIHVG